MMSNFASTRPAEQQLTQETIAPLRHSEDEFENMLEKLLSPESDVLVDHASSSYTYVNSESAALFSDVTIFAPLTTTPNTPQPIWGIGCDDASATGEVMRVDGFINSFAFSTPPTSYGLQDEDGLSPFKNGSDAYVCNTCGSTFNRLCDLSLVIYRSYVMASGQ